MKTETATQPQAQAAPTPGPWEAVVSDGQKSGCRISASIQPEGFLQTICHVYEKGQPIYDAAGNVTGWDGRDEMIANALLICRAVNSHAALTKALSDLLWEPNCPEVIAAARAALALAGEDAR